MPLKVKLDSQSATRKLRDFGVYKARSRNFDIEAQSRSFDIDENEGNAWDETEVELGNFSSLEPTVTVPKLQILSNSNYETTGKGSADEDYLINAAAHYTFGRL